MVDLALQWLPWLVLAALGVGLLWRALSRSDEPKQLVWRWLGTVLLVAGIIFIARRGFRGGGGVGGGLAGAYAMVMVMVGLIAAMGIGLGLIWGKSFGEFVARPLTNLFDEGTQEIKPAPLYSIAEARRKAGHYREAMEEVGRQLAKFPGDVQGTLMMAAIQAEDLHDLPGAVSTIEEWLANHPEDAGGQAVVLTQLAGWHLSLGHDVVAARACLETIVNRFPDSEAAFLAEQRLAHLEAEAAAPRGALALPEQPTRFRSPGEPVLPTVPPTEPEVEVLQRQLAAHPHDVSARERLAMAYAWDYGQADRARIELETLLALPQASPRSVAHWLNLLADVEIQVGKDEGAARAALQRIIDRNPNSAGAEQAKGRLRLLSREMARHIAREPVRSKDH